MDTRKMEKITALVISTIVVGLSFFKVWDWQTVGIYAGSDIAGRVLYPFFHANILHASLNSWCLLSMVFIMNFYWFINSYFNSRKLKLIPLDKILIWCGINSLALLGLHILFVDTFWIVRNKLHLVNYSWTILEFALIVAICYFATTLIKRYIPSVL